MIKNSYRALLFLLTVSLFILLQSCNSNTSNIAERRIQGKWKQVKSTESTSNTDIEYMFSAGKKFNMLTTVTLFTFIRGIRKYGTMRMIVFFLFTFAISWSYETCSILTGFPFGNYYYSDALGPKLWLVPLLIMPAYFTVCYLSWIIAHVLLDKFQASLNKMMVFAVPLIASFIMVMWDVSMDPVRATISLRVQTPQDSSVALLVIFYVYLQAVIYKSASVQRRTFNE